MDILFQIFYPRFRLRGFATYWPMLSIERNHLDMFKLSQKVEATGKNQLTACQFNTWRPCKTESICRQKSTRITLGCLTECIPLFANLKRWKKIAIPLPPALERTQCVTKLKWNCNHGPAGGSGALKLLKGSYLIGGQTRFSGKLRINKIQAMLEWLPDTI